MIKNIFFLIRAIQGSLNPKNGVLKQIVVHSHSI